MYYLAREKMERERVYGRGVFADSRVSVLGSAAVNAATPVTASIPAQQAPPSQQDAGTQQVAAKGEVGAVAGPTPSMAHTATAGTIERKEAASERERKVSIWSR